MPPRAGSSVHHVVIVNDHGRHVVVPGQLVTGVGDIVVFHSLVVGAISLIFPTPVLRRRRVRAPVDRVELPAGGSATLEVASDDSVRPGCYTYLAYCAAVDELAVGGSQPKIIIYR